MFFLNTISPEGGGVFFVCQKVFGFFYNHES